MSCQFNAFHSNLIDLYFSNHRYADGEPKLVGSIPVYDTFITEFPVGGLLGLSLWYILYTPSPTLLTGSESSKSYVIGPTWRINWCITRRCSLTRSAGCWIQFSWFVFLYLDRNQMLFPQPYSSISRRFMIVLTWSSRPSGPTSKTFLFSFGALLWKVRTLIRVYAIYLGASNTE